VTAEEFFTNIVNLFRPLTKMDYNISLPLVRKISVHSNSEKHTWALCKYLLASLKTIEVVLRIWLMRHGILELLFL
jgi:hypothetical protein